MDTPREETFAANPAAIKASINTVIAGWNSAGSAARHLDDQMYSQDGKWGFEEGPMYFLDLYRGCLNQVLFELVELFDDLSDLTVALGDLAKKAPETDGSVMTSADLQEMLDRLDGKTTPAGDSGKASASSDSGGFRE